MSWSVAASIPPLFRHLSTIRHKFFISLEKLVFYEQISLGSCSSGVCKKIYPLSYYCGNRFSCLSYTFMLNVRWKLNPSVTFLNFEIFMGPFLSFFSIERSSILARRWTCIIGTITINATSIFLALSPYSSSFSLPLCVEPHPMYIWTNIWISQFSGKLYVVCQQFY